VDGGRHRDEVHQRASTVVALPGLLRELGVEPGPVFAGTGVDLETLTAETRIPFGSLALLLEQAVAATGRADLGLMLGERFVFAHHGVIAELMRTAPTLGAALRAFTRWQGGYSSGAVVYLHSEGDMTAFGSAVCSVSVRPGRVYTDLVLAIGARMLGLLTGGAAGLSEVYVTHRRPAEVGLYARVFGAPVRFGEPLSCMYLPTEALGLPLPGRDAVRHAEVTALIVEARRGQGPALETLVRGALRKLILVAKPTMEAVAEELALHPRTLRRRLKADGFVFEDLRDEVRLASALELLELTDLSIADVAAALSYASPEVFSEAFRRMRDVSPREWRAMHARAG
jgi:AraC-like DNA-binding protein